MKLQETRDRESLELERIRQCAIRDIAVAHIKVDREGEVIKKSPIGYLLTQKG